MRRLFGLVLCACTQVPDGSSPGPSPVIARSGVDAGVDAADGGKPFACGVIAAPPVPCAGCVPTLLSRAPEGAAVSGVAAFPGFAVYASAKDGVGAVYRTGDPPVALTERFEAPRVLAKAGPYVFVRGVRAGDTSSFLRRIDTRAACAPTCTAPETILEEKATSRFVAVVPRGEDELFLLRSTGTVWFMRRVAPGQWGALVVPSQGSVSPCTLVGGVDVFLGCGFTVTRIAPGGVLAPQGLLGTSEAPLDSLAVSCGQLFGHAARAGRGAFYDFSVAAAPKAVPCVGDGCGDAVRALAADAASLYWASDRGLYRLPRGGGESRRIAEGDVVDLDLDADAVTFADGAARVQRLAK